MTNSEDRPQLTERQRIARAYRLAHAQGLALKKSRTRNERSPSFGGYMLLDARSGAVVAGGHPFEFSMSLDDVEEHFRRIGLIDDDSADEN
jgi:hypothetical protein